MGKGQKVPVTRRALLQRINRKLAKSAEVVKASRGDRLEQEVGAYYRLDLRRNVITAKHVDPEALGRELGVIHPWERLIAGEGAGR